MNETNQGSPRRTNAFWGTLWFGSEGKQLTTNASPRTLESHCAIADFTSSPDALLAGIYGKDDLVLGHRKAMGRDREGGAVYLCGRTVFAVPGGIPSGGSGIVAIGRLVARCSSSCSL